MWEEILKWKGVLGACAWAQGTLTAPWSGQARSRPLRSPPFCSADGQSGGAGQESCRLRDTVELEVCCGPGGAGVLTPQQVLAGQTRWVDQGSV